MLGIESRMLLGQESHLASQSLEEGMRHFYAAQFDSAIAVLRPLLQQRESDPETLFQANLYVGFSLIRQGESDVLIDKVFHEAVRLQPNRQPDRTRIPPDLADRYQKSRDALLGGLLVYCEPIFSQVILMDSRYGPQTDEGIPARFLSLLPGDYQLIVSQKGYKDHLVRVSISPGTQDSLLVELERKLPIWKKWTTWAGGAAMVTALVVTQISGASSESEKESELPTPPVHP